MKEESEPVTEDEWLIRLVWGDFLTDKVPPIRPRAFDPSKKHTDGLSLFRRSCLADPADALLAIAKVENRPKNAIVQIPFRLLLENGFDVTPSPIPEVRGHVVVSGWTYAAEQAEDQSAENRFTALKKILADVASRNIIRPNPVKP